MNLIEESTSLSTTSISKTCTSSSTSSHPSLILYMQVASLLLQHDQHHSLSHGSAYDGVRLALHPSVYESRRSPSSPL